MHLLGRRGLLLGVLAGAMLAGCGGASGDAITADDMVLGSANAPATLIEYASTTCPHCAHFHETVWAQLKSTYIDTGRVRFVFREYPTAPATVALAGFQLARCGSATPEQYFQRLSVLFRQQDTIRAAADAEAIRAIFVDIGDAAGLTQPQVLQCLSDPAGVERVRRIAQASERQNITGTPTLILNGRKLESNDAVTWEGLSREINAALGGS